MTGSSALARAPDAASGLAGSVGTASLQTTRAAVSLRDMPRRTPRSRRPAPRRTASAARGRAGIVMLAFADAQILDVTGPLEVFAIATRLLEAHGSRDPGYQLELVAMSAGPVRMSSGSSWSRARRARRARSRSTRCSCRAAGAPGAPRSDAATIDGSAHGRARAAHRRRVQRRVPARARGAPRRAPRHAPTGATARSSRGCSRA
jgi:hypothetical protein